MATVLAQPDMVDPFTILRRHGTKVGLIGLLLVEVLILSCRFDSKALIALYEVIAQPALHADSVLIVRNGHVVSEAHFAPYEAGLVHDLRSVTKSVLGTLIGIALEQGRIRALEQPVMSFFPEHRAIDPRQRTMTVEHLLDMRAGIEWREWPYDCLLYTSDAADE